MEKYGFFGGCFNPITKAHLSFAKRAIQECGLAKVIIMPMANSYPKEELIEANTRIEMIKLAIKEESKIEVSDLEIRLEKKMDVREAFEEIKKEYENIIPVFMLGADNLPKLLKREDAKEIFAENEFLILEREGASMEEMKKNELLQIDEEKIHFLENRFFQTVNSTKIRRLKNTQAWEEIKKQLPEPVWKYIEEKKLYKK